MPTKLLADLPGRADIQCYFIYSVHLLFFFFSMKFSSLNNLDSPLPLGHSHHHMLLPPYQADQHGFTLLTGTPETRLELSNKM